MGLEYDKRPADYYKNYLDNIRKVSAKDVLRVAQQYLHPESLTIYVVGHKADFDESLEELGKVTEIALVPRRWIKTKGCQKHRVKFTSRRWCIRRINVSRP